MYALIKLLEVIFFYIQRNYKAFSNPYNNLKKDDLNSGEEEVLKENEPLRVAYEKLDNKGFDSGGGEILYYRGKPFTGTIVEYYKNGVLLGEEEFNNGHIGGAQRTYHPNGQLADEHFIAFNTLYGLLREWDEQGNLVREHDFGPKPIIPDYFEFNKKDFEVNPSNFLTGMKYKGKPFTGRLVMNYQQDDRKFIDFKDGNVHGNYLGYWTRGQKAVDSVYEDGKLLIEKRWYGNGEMERDWDYAVSGKAWYDNGQLKEQWDGKNYFYWDENGVIIP
jgi:antitoxin component YwqK of YwqJK toxin-antitoxin module